MNNQSLYGAHVNKLSVQDLSKGFGGTPILQAVSFKAEENAANTQFLFKTMSLCKMGMSRMRAKMPLRTMVAEKTGTLGSMVNDAGIILLPNDLGPLVLVINIDDITTSVPLREEVISKIAKRIYDEIVFG